MRDCVMPFVLPYQLVIPYKAKWTTTAQSLDQVVFAASCNQVLPQLLCRAFAREGATGVKQTNMHDAHDDTVMIDLREVQGILMRTVNFYTK